MLKKVWYPGVFKYLGSYITEDLCEDFDVNERISKASGAFGKCKKMIFKNRELSVESKARAFNVFVLSILFYQSECWALRDDQKRRVCVFFNRCVRVLTGINRLMQHHRHLTSEDMAKKAGLRSCESYLNERLLSWAGHVARMATSQMPRWTLFAWYDGPRASGKPHFTLRHRLTILLRKLPDKLSVAARSSLLKHGWVHAAQDREKWVDITRTYCNCEGVKRLKNDRKIQHLEGRAYAVKFRDDEAESGGGGGGGGIGGHFQGINPPPI